MLIKKEDELRIILQEGAEAVRQMRRGLENACAGLQHFYGKEADYRKAEASEELNLLKVSESGKIYSRT